LYLPFPRTPHTSTPKPNHLKSASPPLPAHAYARLILPIQHLRNTAATMHDDSRFRKTSLDGLAALEYIADFLERAAPCLDEEEVNEYKLEYIPENEEEIVLNPQISISFTSVVNRTRRNYLPPRARERNAGDKRVVKVCNVDQEII
jgi:hypothetical protein